MALYYVSSMNPLSCVLWLNPISRQTLNPGFVSAFVSAFLMIIVSEIGDKTFFIAAILAMSHPRKEIFLASSAALLLMTVFSVVLGMALPAVLPPRYTHFASCVLFVVFGAKLLYEVIHGDDDDENDELKEVEEELHSAEKSDQNALELTNLNDLESGETKKKAADSSMWSMRRLFSPIVIQCFTMTFVAEWGDRSQIATIAMAASQDVYGVTLGAYIGHSLCTGVAVLGGKLLASRISERTVNTVGGILFLCFAIVGFLQGAPTAAVTGVTGTVSVVGV